MVEDVFCCFLVRGLAAFLVGVFSFDLLAFLADVVIAESESTWGLDADYFLNGFGSFKKIGLYKNIFETYHSAIVGW